MGPLHFLSLVDFKTVRSPGSQGDPEPLAGPHFEAVLPQGMDATVLAALLMLGLAFIALQMLRRSKRPPRKRSRRAGRQTSRRMPRSAKPSGPYILVDGSNVMHWQDNQPKLAPLLAVIGRLQALGYVPGVVFDANAGWKLFDHYMDEGDLAHLLHIPREQVFVVPKGQQADPWLLAVARDHKARIVTNDRFRDWAEAHPEVLEPGVLVRGGWQAGEVDLPGLAAAKAGAPGGG
jgi:hypothetical protein